VQQDALDDARLLGDLRQFNQISIRVTAIFTGKSDFPILRRRQIFAVTTLIPQLDLRTGNADLDHADSDILREIGDHCPAKRIDERNASRATSQRRNRVIPLPLLPAATRIVKIRQHLKARINRALLLFNASSTFHVRLPEAQVDVEIRVGLSQSLRGGSQQHGKKEQCHLHFHNARLHLQVRL
jgi:hypothetical protein